MAAKKVGCSSPAVLNCMLFLLMITPRSSFATNNEHFNISSLCSNGRRALMYRRIEGAVVTSDSDEDVSCTATFQTDSVLKRFMLRFEHLSLDCQDHLLVFDGAHAIGKHEVDFSCRSTTLDVGTVFLRSNFVTLKYTTGASRPEGSGFKLVVTALKSPILSSSGTHIQCREFECRNGFCISGSLRCDSVNHCGDNSDEEVCPPDPGELPNSEVPGIDALVIRLLFLLLGG